MCPITSHNPCWRPFWLSNAWATRKDSESECLAKDNPETNPITIKLETVNHMAEQFSWVNIRWVSGAVQSSLHVLPCLIFGTFYEAVRRTDVRITLQGETNVFENVTNWRKLFISTSRESVDWLGKKMLMSYLEWEGKPKAPIMLVRDCGLMNYKAFVLPFRDPAFPLNRN